MVRSSWRSSVADRDGNVEMQQVQVFDETVRGVAFRVAGRVQGVAFRWFGRGVADELGVKGWIRNRMDGSVEGEAFGDPLLLERFLDRLRQGPAAARVKSLEWEVIPEQSSSGSFEIRF